MKLKLLYTLCTIAGAMSAQTINGVTISGSADNPMLVNHSGKGVMAYVVRRVGTNWNRVITVPDLPALMRGQSIPDGPLGFFTGIVRSHMNHATGQMVEEGDATRWELVGVLLADGKYSGDPSEFDAIAKMFYNFRSFARSVQYAAPENRKAVLLGTKKLQSIPEVGLSIDPALAEHQSNLARNLLDLPPSELGSAIDRLAALPDVTRGESR